MLLLLFVITVMQGIYNCIPEKPHVCRKYSVAAILYLTLYVTDNLIFHVKWSVLLL